MHDVLDLDVLEIHIAEHHANGVHAHGVKAACRGRGHGFLHDMPQHVLLKRRPRCGRSAWHLHVALAAPKVDHHEDPLGIVHGALACLEPALDVLPAPLLPVASWVRQHRFALHMRDERGVPNDRIVGVEALCHELGPTRS